MTFDEWKKQYRVQLPADLKASVYQVIDEYGDVTRAAKSKSFQRRNMLAGFGSAAAAVVIAGILMTNSQWMHTGNKGYSQVPIPTHQQQGSYPGPVQTSSFASFKLTRKQMQEIRSAQAEIGLQGVTIYVPSELPKDPDMNKIGVQGGIQTIHGHTHGLLTVIYNKFDITCSSSKYIPQYSKPFRTVEIDGVLAKWHKNLLPQLTMPSPRHKPDSVQYILEFTKGSTHIEIATMLEPQHISMVDIENVAKHLVPLKG